MRWFFSFFKMIIDSVSEKTHKNRFNVTSLLCLFFCAHIFFISFYHSSGPPCMVHLGVDSIPAVLKVHFELTTKADTCGTLLLIDRWDHWSNFKTFEFLLCILPFFVRSGIKLISLCLMQGFALEGGKNETKLINKYTRETGPSQWHKDFYRLDQLNLSYLERWDAITR